VPDVTKNEVRTADVRPPQPRPAPCQHRR
jgi:hypothetical protein